MRLLTLVIAMVLFIVVLISAGLLYAGQQYNPLENRWETVPDRYELQYNAFDNEWSYQAPSADLEYNAFENRWEWNSEPSVIQPYPCEVEYDLYQRGDTY